MVRRRACAVVLAAASVLASAAPAWAVCDPPAAVSGTTVTCSGTTNVAPSYGDGTQDDVTVNVLSGATVTGTVDGFRLKDDITIINSGSISGPNSGITVVTLESLANSGSISGGNGVFAATSIETLANSGSITGSTGISTSTIANLTNSGSIEGTNLFGINATTIGSLINSGAITANGPAIRAAVSVGSLTNSGLIESTTDNAIHAREIGSFVNSGLIIGARGILVDVGSLQSLVNTGEIRGTLGGGVEAAAIGSLVNHGVITGGTDGVSSDPITSLINTGSISGGSGAGVDAGDITSLANSGSISGGNQGVDAATINALTNSGSIIGGSLGIQSIRIANLTNSGLISGSSVGNFAIFENAGGPDTTLTLLAGSVIIGRIDLGGGTNTLNVGNGLSIMNTFVGAAPVIGTTNGAPYVVSGNQVAVFDPTNLANADEMLVDLTDGIFSTLQGRLSGLRAGFAGTTVAASGPLTPPMALGMNLGAPGYAATASTPALRGQYWAEGFAARRDQEGDSPSVGSEQRLAGFVTGLDAPVDAATVAGFLFGASWADTDADFNSQSTDADSVFGGAYASTLWGSSVVDLAIVGGRADFDRTRRVANNTVPTGIQVATAGYDGWFIAPEARLTQPLLALGDQRLEGIVSLRYAGLFVDGFAETGAADALSIGDRDIHVGVARAGLALPLEHRSGATLARLVLTGGLEGYTQFGDDNLQGVLLGQNIVFSSGGDDGIIGLYAGAEAQVVMVDGARAFAGLEGLAEDDGSHRLSGKAGVRLPF